MKKCNTCNAEFASWETFAEGGEKVERCPVCNNTKQMSDAVDEFKGQTEVSMRPCDFCGQEYSFKDTRTNICPTCKEEALSESEVWPDFSRNGRIYKETASMVEVVGHGGAGLNGVMEVARGITAVKQFIPSSGPHPFQAITDEMYRLYVRKNHDYGDSFAIQFRKLGMASSIIRLSDKLSRLESLHGKQAQVTDESIRDTLIDLANYAILTVMEIDAASDTNPQE